MHTFTSTLRLLPRAQRRATSCPSDSMWSKSCSNRFGHTHTHDVCTHIRNLKSRPYCAPIDSFVHTNSPVLLSTHMHIPTHLCSYRLICPYQLTCAPTDSFARTNSPVLLPNYSPVPTHLCSYRLICRSPALQPDKDGNGGGLVREAVMGRFPEDDASDVQGMASNGHQTQLELDLEVNSQYEVCIMQDEKRRLCMVITFGVGIVCIHYDQKCFLETNLPFWRAGVCVRRVGWRLLGPASR